MTDTKLSHRLGLVLVVAALVIVTGLAMAWRANASEVSEPATDPFVVRVAPTPVRPSTATVTPGVRVELGDDACAPKRLTVLAPENCP